MLEKKPSFRARQVATALRRHREAAGMSCHDVARHTGMSHSKVSRLETGVSGLQEADLATLLGLYRVPASDRDELLELLRRSEERGWWAHQPGLPQPWSGLMDVEDQAVRIQNSENMVVPGLLQTADYARAVIEAMGDPLTPAELDMLVAARIARQTLLARSTGPQLVAVVDESALRRQVGAPGVLRRQLQHLLVVADQPNVLLRVVPIETGPHRGMEGAFSVLEFADDTGVVYIENQRTCLFLEDPADVQRYRTALGTILSAAVTPDATVELIATLAESQSATP